MSQPTVVARRNHHFWRISILLLLTALVRFGSLALPTDAWLRVGVAGHHETRLTAGAWTSCWSGPIAVELPETSFFSPGVPGILSALHRLGATANPDFWLHWLAILSGCLVPLAAYGLVLATGACPNRAWAAGALIAIDPLLIAATGVPVPAALTGTMVLFSMATAMGTVRSGSWALAALTGITAAGTSLLEGRLLPWAIFLMSWTIFHLRLQTFGWMAMVSGAVTFLIPLAMTAAGTAKHLGESWPISPSWGAYVAEGAGLDPHPEAPESESAMQRSKRLGRLAMEAIHLAPARWLAGRLQNLPGIFLGTDTPAHLPTLTDAETQPLSVSGLAGWWLLVMPILGWIGLVTLASRMGEGGLLTWSLLVLPLPWLLGPATTDLSARIPLECLLTLLVVMGILRHPPDSPHHLPKSGS